MMKKKKEIAGALLLSLFLRSHQRSRSLCAAAAGSSSRAPSEHAEGDRWCAAAASSFFCALSEHEEEEGDRWCAAAASSLLRSHKRRRSLVRRGR
jgi:hypothetical protein